MEGIRDFLKVLQELGSLDFGGDMKTSFLKTINLLLVAKSRFMVLRLVTHSP